MKLRVIVALLIVALIVAAWVLWPRGYSELVITDFSKPVHLFARAPFFPFRQGLMYVVIEGELEGKGEISVYENSSTAGETFPVFGPRVYYVYGGSENWTNRVGVTFVPGSVSKGRILIRVYCGAYPKPIDRNAKQGGAADLAPLNG